MERFNLLPFVNDKAAVSAYKLLRTRLLQRMRDHHWKSLIVTGILPGDGKTTTAINLSVGASQDVSQSVLLVDLDLQRPAVAKNLGLQRVPGLSDYLTGTAELKQIIYNTEIERLALLPNFEPVTSSESFASPKMLALLDYLRGLDPNLLIVFDMPPALSSDDVLAFGPHVDALLLVIAEGRTSRALLQRANEMLEGIPRVGTVLNRSSEGDSGYYY
jgi:Mrp family chromosome partitioning ATPase